MVSAYGSNMRPITKGGKERDATSMQRLYPTLRHNLVILRRDIHTGAGQRTTWYERSVKRKTSNFVRSYTHSPLAGTKTSARENPVLSLLIGLGYLAYKSLLPDLRHLFVFRASCQTSVSPLSWYPFLPEAGYNLNQYLAKHLSTINSPSC